VIPERRQTCFGRPALARAGHPAVIEDGGTARHGTTRPCSIVLPPSRPAADDVRLGTRMIAWGFSSRGRADAVARRFFGVAAAGGIAVVINESLRPRQVRAHARSIGRDNPHQLRRPPVPASRGRLEKHAAARVLIASEPDRRACPPPRLQRRWPVSVWTRRRSSSRPARRACPKGGHGSRTPISWPRAENGDCVPRHHRGGSSGQRAAVQLRVWHEPGCSVAVGKRSRHSLARALPHLPPSLSRRCGHSRSRLLAAVPPLWQAAPERAGVFVTSRWRVSASSRMAGGHLPVPVVSRASQGAAAGSAVPDVRP